MTICVLHFDGMEDGVLPGPVTKFVVGYACMQMAHTMARSTDVGQCKLHVISRLRIRA
jgi:hypothetical protein